MREILSRRSGTQQPETTVLPNRAGKILSSWMMIFQITPPCFSLVVGIPTYPSEK